MNAPTAHDFFDLSRTAHAVLFTDDEPVWAVLGKLGDYLKRELVPGNQARCIGHPVIGDMVHLGEGTVVEPGAYIEGPAWIGKNCRIRQGAYLRANVIAGDGCVLGNSSEFKNCLLFDGAEVPHFNYVGDSVLGHKAHLGAGVICSNLRSDKAEVKVFWRGGRFSTGLRKFGALVGDGVEVGCQAVLNPGSLLGPGAIVHPGVIWAGTLEGGRTAINRAIQRGTGKSA
jgi:UDP-N-acetylglucosamine diphosphorylase / glucose-1-phosphate thymidylyltransferase / UDP-N-acetylgalactosamine diphosphorylase / glucosamine-1-phosphate N-acetyltransferase / galactosamine-1-phosphate N-acetyltransferase